MEHIRELKNKIKMKLKKNIFCTRLFLNNIFHSYLLFLVSKMHFRFNLSKGVTRNRRKEVGNAEGSSGYGKKKY